MDTEKDQAIGKLKKMAAECAEQRYLVSTIQDEQSMLFKNALGVYQHMKSNLAVHTMHCVEKEYL